MKEVKELKVGDMAPGFELMGQDGAMLKLSSLKGGKVLLYFYPKADTPGCTTQACSIRDAKTDLEGLGVTALGVSPDMYDKISRFDKKYSLGFRLLSDPDHVASMAYGVWRGKTVGGQAKMGIVRSSFLVGEDGKLLGVWYGVKPEDTVPNAIALLKK